MRWRGARRRSVWAAWLGVVALGLNALVPVHIAFRVAEALSVPYCGHIETAADTAGNAVEQRLLAVLSLGADTPQAGSHGSHKNAPCPVCSALGALASVTLPLPAATPAPQVEIALSRTPAPFVAAPETIFPAGYRSRAPPIA